MNYWKKYIILFLMILFWTGLHVYWQSSLQLPVELEGKTISLQGNVVSDPIIKSNSTRFLFDTAEYGQVQLDWYRHAPEIKKGQVWELNARLKRPRNFKNPGGFNYERYLFLNRISATGYVYERAGVELLFVPEEKINIRQQIAQDIDRALDDRPHAALIKGLAVGIRDTMTDDQWALLQKTGTSHLLAISGLHIGLVSGLMFFLTRFLWAQLPRLPLYMPAPYVGAVFAIIGAFIYSALAGFAIPTQRALIMIVIVMWCVCSRYRFKNRHVLGFAGIIVVVCDPFALFSASFWLSFIAVGLLFAVSLQQAPKWHKWVSIQWYISLGLTPLVIVYFKQISWVSPLANFLAIPWASFTVVPLTLLGVVGSFIDLRVAQFFWLLAESALNYLQWFLEYLSHFSWAWQTYVVSSWRVWLAIILSGLLLLLPRGIPCRYLGFILLLTIMFVRHPKPDVGEAWLTVLDVGQGLAVVVQTAEHVLLYDTGMRYDQFDLGEAVIMPYLRYQGIDIIDTLILSHNNLDHTGGAEYLINNIKINHIVSGEAITDLKINNRCRAGQSWQWDEVHFSFLFPQEESNNSNNNSCVLKITAGDKVALLTGDIEKEAEAWLVQHAGVELKADILLAPHHGSRTSSTWPFIKATDPSEVIFATGHLNRYHFPQNQVVDRYTSQGAKIYNTAKDGAVKFVLP